MSRRQKSRPKERAPETRPEAAPIRTISSDDPARQPRKPKTPKSQVGSAAAAEPAATARQVRAGWNPHSSATWAMMPQSIHCEGKTPALPISENTRTHGKRKRTDRPWNAAMQMDINPTSAHVMAASTLDTNPEADERRQSPQGKGCLPCRDVFRQPDHSGSAAKTLLRGGHRLLLRPPGAPGCDGRDAFTPDGPRDDPKLPGNLCSGRATAGPGSSRRRTGGARAMPPRAAKQHRPPRMPNEANTAGTLKMPAPMMVPNIVRRPHGPWNSQPFGKHTIHSSGDPENLPTPYPRLPRPIPSPAPRPASKVSP